MKKIYQYTVVGLLGCLMMAACQREELPPLTEVMIDSLVIAFCKKNMELVPSFSPSLRLWSSFSVGFFLDNFRYL